MTTRFLVERGGKVAVAYAFVDEVRQLTNEEPLFTETMAANSRAELIELLRATADLVETGRLPTACVVETRQTVVTWPVAS